MILLELCLFLSLSAVCSANGSQMSAADRIVGGSAIDISKVPFMLSFMVNSEHACGASILSKDWALTAAHCVVSFLPPSPANVTVRSGSNNHDYGGTVHNVTHMIVHEKYNSDNEDYDVAVVRVHPPFNFSRVAQPVKLPRRSSFVNESWGLIAGWGYFIDMDPVLSEDLEYVVLPRVSRETCRQNYAGRYEVTDRQICYGFQNGGKDSCKGDSGGALTVDSTAIGITSWGDECAAERSPGVYTDVISVVDWIRNKAMLDE
ncbi:trypsin-1 [Nomia melanderi]|uniref:trypsin-1 n=1 Tax=Nomia melanderi TaxID=2448451 RepID=UPI001303FD20|nr:trypsin-1-like [Nomia melanderi]